MDIQNRKYKNGGVVAQYVDRSLKSKLILRRTITVEEVTECLTIGIIMENRRDLFVHFFIQSTGIKWGSV